MRQNPHVRICGGPGSATTLVYPTGTGRDYRLGFDLGLLGARRKSGLQAGSAAQRRETLHLGGGAAGGVDQRLLGSTVSW